MPSFDEEKEERGTTNNNKKEKGIRKGLRNDEKRLLLETRKHIFEPIEKNDACAYFCGFKAYSSLVKRKRKIKHKKELKKSAFYTQSIVKMFSA